MTTALANRQGQLAPLKNVNPEDILERYLAEETSTEIAQSLGVTKSALSLFMLKHAEEQWRSAQVVKALKRKEEAEDLIETASNPLDLARAREKLKSAQWDLERVCRRIYGQDVTPDQLGKVSITLNLSHKTQHDSGQVIDIQGSTADSTTDAQSVAAKPE
jgi:predicted transcriptional regulator